MSNFILLAIGASAGGLIRWQIENNLLCNVIGTLIIGILVSMKSKKELHLLIGVGFCGALTTFSGWIMECIELMSANQFMKATQLIFMTLGLGLIAAILGFAIGYGIKHLKLFQSQSSIRRSEVRQRF